MIRTITMKSMGKSLHVKFHSALVEDVARRGGADAIGLEPTTMEAYAAAVAEELAHMARQGKSGITEQLSARREAARRFVGDLNRHIAHYKHYYLGRDRDEVASSSTEAGAQ